MLNSLFVFADERVNLNIPWKPKMEDILSFAVKFLFIIAGLMALLYLILGAISWITSGGSKEGVEKARNKIEAAIVGLVVLFAALAIIALLENVLNIGLGLTKTIIFPQLGGTSGAL